jgi:hypothetical protein
MLLYDRTWQNKEQRHGVRRGLPTLAALQYTVIMMDGLIGKSTLKQRNGSA